MFPNTLNLIIYLLVLPFLSYSRSAPMSLSYNNKYIYTSTLTIPTSQTYNSSDFYVPYPATYSNASTVSVVISINDIRMDFPSNRAEFSSGWQRWSTYFILEITSSMFNNFQILVMRYLILTDQYSAINNTNMTNVMGSFNSTVVLNSNNFASSTFIAPQVYSTSITWKYFCMLIGFDLNSTTTANILEFHAVVHSLNSSHIVVRYFANSTVDIILNFAKISLIIYNQGAYNQPGFASFQFVSIIQSLSPTNSMSYFNPQSVHSFSTMVGLTGFHAQHNLDMSITFQDPDSFIVSSQNSADYMSLNFLLLATFYCNYSNPYYFSSDSLCYDTCPDRTYNNINSLSCHQCPQDCLTCTSNGGCLSCSSADHRQLVQTRCLPLLGYYETNSTTAGKCPEGCSTCSSGLNCTSCFGGYTLKNDYCGKVNPLDIPSIWIYIFCGGLFVLMLIIMAINIGICKKIPPTSQRQAPNSQAFSLNRQSQQILQGQQDNPYLNRSKNTPNQPSSHPRSSSKPKEQSKMEDRESQYLVRQREPGKSRQERDSLHQSRRMSKESREPREYQHLRIKKPMEEKQIEQEQEDIPELIESNNSIAKGQNI